MEYIEESRKSKILKLINEIRSKSFHQGTFASIAHKYPSDFNRQATDIDEVFAKILSLLTITEKVDSN